jgi:hypothetical protein
MINSMNATVCGHEFMVRTGSTRSLARAVEKASQEGRKTMMTRGNKNFKIAPVRDGPLPATRSGQATVSAAASGEAKDRGLLRHVIRQATAAREAREARLNAIERPPEWR